MKNIKIHPYPVSNNPALALWQSAVAEVAKEDILNKIPNIESDELNGAVRIHPMVQGANFHVIEADGSDRKMDLKQIEPYLANIEDENNIPPIVHAYLSQQYYDALLKYIQENGNKPDSQETLVPPVEFPYSDYAYAQWFKCAAIWGKDGNPIPGPYVHVNDHGGPESDFGVITIPENSKIAIIGDFGTGLSDATTMIIAILEQLNPDMIIHLGDIYYAGTQGECQTYVDTFNQAFRIAGKKVPVFSIPGNHEYYAGGWGFFEKVIKMNEENGFPEYAQHASYFCLRTADHNWQFLGMDTGYNSVHNFNVAHPTQLNASYAPWLAFDEAAWHQNKLEQFGGQTILLSHHQLFSADSVINDGKGVKYQTGSNEEQLKYLNGNLLAVFQYAFPRVAAWYWGHEHTMDIFKENQLGLRKGRLVGNSGYEEWQGEDPYKHTDSPYQDYTPRVKLGVTPVAWEHIAFNFYNHGFTLITLDRSNAIADYFQYPVFSPDSPIPRNIPGIQGFPYSRESLNNSDHLIEHQSVEQVTAEIVEPGLAIQTVSDYTLIWNDKGSGGKYDGAFYRPTVPEGYYMIGDYGQSNYDSPNESIVVVKPLTQDAIAHPVDYKLIWADHDSGSDRDGSFWRPIPPEGYQAIGTVGQSGYDKPSLDTVVCIREDYLVPGKVGTMIWNDKDTGADTDFGAWKIIGNSEEAVACNTFLGVPNHNKPNSSPILHCINAKVIGVEVPTTREGVEQLVKRFAPIIYFNTEEKYLMTSAEWFIERANLVNNETKESVQATMNNLPIGKANENKFHLELHDSSVRGGDLSVAKAYVHAKIMDNIYLDLQYWFLYAYNGPGTAKAGGSIFGVEHTGESSLKPLGEHQGDWEHITVRLNLSSLELNSVYFSQHSGGQWVLPHDLEIENGHIVIYSSLNGHASYPHQGPNYTEHRSYKKLGTGLDFWLVNKADKGQRLDCSEAHELISAEFLPEGQKPVEPRWLNFLNRWGKSNEAHLTQAAVQGILDDVFGKIFGTIIGYTSFLALLAKLLLTYFVTEDQNGPTGPKMKGSWNAEED